MITFILQTGKVIRELYRVLGLPMPGRPWNWRRKLHQILVNARLSRDVFQRLHYIFHLSAEAKVAINHHDTYLASIAIEEAQSELRALHRWGYCAKPV